MEQNVALLLLLVATFAATSGQEVVPCMRTMANCTAIGGRTGFSSLSIVNNEYHCCAAGYSMSWFNNVCSCTKYSEVVPCDEDPVQCGRFASSISYNRGKVVCCHAGFSMASSTSYVNGIQFSSCTCTRYFSNLGGVVIGNTGMVNGSLDANFNATEFAQRMNEWGQRFSQRLSSSLQTMGGNIRRSMGNMMFGLNRSMGNMMFGLNRSLGNMFRNRWF